MKFGDLKKYDIKIEIKNEKEIMRFLGLVFFTALLSYILFDGRDYIWNMTIWRLTGYVFPWLAIIPAFIVFKKRGDKIRDLFSGDVKLHILIGVLMGSVLAVCILAVYDNIRGYGNPGDGFDNVEQVVKIVVRQFFFTAPTEEFIYRVGIQEELERLLEKYKFIAPLVSSVLFGLYHIICGTWTQVLIAIVTGLVFGYAKAYIKKCTYLTVVIAHGVYNCLVTMLPILGVVFA